MLEVEAGKPHATARCGALTKAGAPCTKAAGWRTDHPGSGRCYLHGGAGGRPIEHGRYSRYSIITSAEARRLREHFEADPDPLNLLPEVIELRVRIADFCNRYDEFSTALLGWHGSWSGDWSQAVESWEEDYANWHAKYVELIERVQDLRKNDRTLANLGDPPAPPDPGDMLQRPRKIVDILQAGQFLGLAGTMVDRIKRREEEKGFTLQDIDAIIKQHGVEFVAALREVLGDNDELREQILTAVADRWDIIPIAKAAKGK
ncbi:hypothetical protein [Armatimonas rosea]|uniref:Uncharacterized protein n=1 Tax=Armatimonas rosea TaxID=685828 RepID=A0A7W9SUU1_ARMRO|nr:hypothetical protein [Armatimonas rosea]MBB6053262.1 hypothetical protein [Armatimonas rosea]